MTFLIGKFFAILMMACVSTASVSYYSPRHSVVYPAAHVYSAHSSSLQTPSQQQYHTQDEFGQYAYGYSEPLSAKQEVRSLDGTTRGSYSYRDADGKLQMVTYTADSDGFHVAATNLPRALSVPEIQQSNPVDVSSSTAAVSDTAEVASARAAHLAAHQTAKLRLATGESTTTDNRARLFSAPSSNVRTLELPHTVEDTPTFVFAKAEPLKSFQHEKLRSVVPMVYNYGYPLNTRLLATGYIF